MAGLNTEQKAEVEALIAQALQKQEVSIGSKVNPILVQADAAYPKLNDFMERSKTIHEAAIIATKEKSGRTLWSAS